ncbi:putative F-box protein [Cardamine amara subsp. amara]|uniref:F-box protein n=1 Tax=Cardamine amara subsp. amara TaxID=228776 RepID=A0ABD0ZBJ1_CARAN
MISRHRSKRRKIKNESQVTSETRRCVDEDSVPRELVFEILLRLPSKSISRFLFVSKLWATIIRSRYFIKTFASRTSLRQPRLLFAFVNSKYKNEQNMWNFFSSSSTPTKESPTYLSLTRCSIPNRSSSDKYINKFPRYVNGLISVGHGEKQIICNPSTGKSITLPKVKSTEKSFQSFFGYDPVDDHYKVLCMSSAESEHQIFTLGGVDKSWRMIEYNILHIPKTNGVCINGIVYYVASTYGNRDEWCLVRFDVRSEKFDQLVKFLGDPSRPPMLFNNPYLMSYKGKATLVDKMEHQRFELWILEDAEKHEWSKIRFQIKHPLIDSYSSRLLRIMDVTNHLGEIVFVFPDSRNPKDFYILCYHHEKKSLWFDKIKDKSYKNIWRFREMIPFFNYVESVMLL